MVGVTIVCVFKTNIMSLSFWNLLQVVWCAKNKKKEIMQIILFCKARDFDFLYYFLLTRTTWKYTQKKFSLVIYELRTTISVTRLSANAFPTFSSSSHLFSKLFLSFGNLHLLLLHIRYFPSFLAPTISKAHKAWENMRRFRLLYWTRGERWEEFGGKLSRAHLPSQVCARVLENRFFCKCALVSVLPGTALFGLIFVPRFWPQCTTVNKKVSHCKR